MASGRRRSTRNLPSSSNEKHPANDTAGPPEEGSNGVAEDKCPACTDESVAQLQFEDKEEWAMCGACKTWYHWRCAGNGEELDTVDKWFCKSCLAADSRRVITFKVPARKSERKRAARDYANLNSGFESDPRRFIRVADAKPSKPDNFRRMQGNQVGIEWLETDPKSMTEPIVIESPEGLDMTMPGDGFTVNDVGLLVGEQTPVEVIDVASQSTSPGWTLGKWVEYCNLAPSARDKILNVISLEVSATPLADRVVPPRLVRELDWVENIWPSTKKGKGNIYPKVQLYCLMGVEGAWTDWHIDFAGSSVYYHIISGSKVFYFIKPTPANFAAYERWSGTEVQNHLWLGDMVEEVLKVTLTQGNTMIIPSGWIHAVYTPVDTLVFGGNFLHSYSVATQLRVREIEIKTHVPKKFRFPLFAKLCWYVGDKYLKDLKTSGIELPSRVLTSLPSLVDFLMSEVHILEQGSEQAKREVKEQIPHDRIKDAPALARELRWRVKHATGCTSDDEDDSGRHQLKRKRKRSESIGIDVTVPRFKNFKPKNWDKVVESCGEPEQLKLQLRRPPENEEDWAEKWVEMEPREGGEEDGEEVTMERTKMAMVKVRKTIHGLERERIERKVERWTWK